MKADLSIVYPCYNPKAGWEKNLVDKHKAIIDCLPVDCTVQMALINDGSVSGINDAHIRYIQTAVPRLLYINNTVNSGKGFALRAAMQEIKTGLIIYTDVDLPYQPDNLLEMFALLQRDACDVVLGERKADYFRQLPFSRRLLSSFLRMSNYLLFPRLFIKDTQAGLKGFNQAGKAVFLKTRINGFLFDAEFIRLCSKAQLRMGKISLQPSSGINFTPIKFSVVLRELRNFFRLLR